MGFLGFGKKKDDGVVDLGARYNRQQAMKEKQNLIPSQTQSQNQGQMNETSQENFFDLGAANFNQQESSGFENSGFESPEEKRKKLARRILDMTTQLENLSNQIYHLQQRVEVLEKKAQVNRFE